MSKALTRVLLDHRMLHGTTICGSACRDARQSEFRQAFSGAGLPNCKNTINRPIASDWPLRRKDSMIYQIDRDTAIITPNIRPGRPDRAAPLRGPEPCPWTREELRQLVLEVMG